MKQLTGSNTKLTIGVLAILIIGYLFNPAQSNAQVSIWQGLEDMKFSEMTIEHVKTGIASPQIKDDGIQYVVPFMGNKVDLTMPQEITHKYLVVTVRGGDGGARTNHKLIKPLIVAGGSGADIQGIYEVGTEDNQISANDVLRFIVGTKGENTESVNTVGAEGGAGTGLFIKKSGSSSWVTLAVAGGGGGAYSDCCSVTSKGRSASSSTSGGDGGGSGTKGGSNGSDGEEALTAGGGGGINRVFIDGEPVGSDNTHDGKYKSILFGCGNGSWAGGTGGGGGGYSGGGAGGVSASGGGGGSYYNPDFGLYLMKINNPTTSPKDGYISFQFTDDLYGFQQIRFAYNTNKCIDDYGSATSNGNNIQTYNCHGDNNQQWLFNLKDRTIRSQLNTNKCLSLKDDTGNNGTNIHLWDCEVNDNQRFLYNGLYKTIHSARNAFKCIDAANGSAYPNSNVNVQLWDCKYTNNNQKWEIAGATTVSNVSNMKHIIPVLAPNFAVHSHTGAESGSNIQLWTKDNTNTAEQWYFDGLAIKMRNNQNLCIDLSQSNTSNGNNIQLYNCNGTNAQQWIYDGMTKTIHSVINQGKCLQIVKNTDGVYGKRSNVEIHDCNGSDEQKFLIQE